MENVKKFLLLLTLPLVFGMLFILELPIWKSFQRKDAEK